MMAVTEERHEEGVELLQNCTLVVSAVAQL